MQKCDEIRAHHFTAFLTPCTPSHVARLWDAPHAALWRYFTRLSQTPPPLPLPHLPLFISAAFWGGREPVKCSGKRSEGEKLHCLSWNTTALGKRGGNKENLVLLSSTSLSLKEVNVCRRKKDGGKSVMTIISQCLRISYRTNSTLECFFFNSLHSRSNPLF